MLPLSLRVRNFLSYRDQAPVLQLEGVHLACLSGANGQGKSALLDSITWALWGKARGQRHEQLLHHGQQEMQVALEFEADGQRYRVVRRYSHARSQPQSSLELSVHAGEAYRPISGNVIAETQAQIVRLLNMDHETFVNSAFLVQGRADLFTMATPTERKEVLASVLGLHLYDRLEALAKQHARDRQARMMATAALADRLREQAVQAEPLRADLAVADAQLAESQRGVAAATERVGLVRQRVAHLERRRDEAGQVTADADRARARLHEAQREVERLGARAQASRDALSGGAGVEAGAAALAAACARWEVLRTTAQRVHALETSLFPIEQRITVARARLEADIASHENQIANELRPRAWAQAQAESHIGEAEAALKALDDRASEVTALERRLHESVAQAVQLRGASKRTLELGKESGAKLQLLDHTHAEGIACPLCEQALDGQAQARLRARYKTEIEAQRARYRDEELQAKRHEAEAARLQDAVDGMRRDTDRRRHAAHQRLGLLQAQRETAVRAQAQLQSTEAVLAELRARHEHGAFAQEDQVAAAALRGHIAAERFEPSALAAAETEVHGLAHWEQAERTLREARARLPEDEEALERAAGRAQAAGDDLTRLDARSSEIAREVADLPGYQAQLHVVARELSEVTARADGLRSHQATLATKLAAATQAARDLVAQEQQHHDLAGQAALYDELAVAFGKGGVQALLIESAIPRLEADANDLLGRMTDGRMALKMETQRQRRTGHAPDGALIETLDINVSDELGHRPYELFSGGERFRIDFALRIALSKLLAWRAGAALPTLFIDEGFGTQDTAGREKLIDVIRAIAPQFRCILVITHMDDIKDAFPVRIEVTRTPTGSTFSMA